jgi:hypothetical protein
MRHPRRERSSFASRRYASSATQTNLDDWRICACGNSAATTSYAAPRNGFGPDDEHRRVPLGMGLLDVLVRDLVDLVDDVATDVRGPLRLHGAGRVNDLRVGSAVVCLIGHEASELLVKAASQAALPNCRVERIVDGGDDHRGAARAIRQGEASYSVPAASSRINRGSAPLNPYRAWSSSPAIRTALLRERSRMNAVSIAQKSWYSSTTIRGYSEILSGCSSRCIRTRRTTSACETAS